MKTAIILTAVLAFTVISFGCGGSAEKKESKAPTAVSNTNTVTSNVNTAAKADDRDADDVKPTAANASNSKAKAGDADDQRTANKAGNSNRPAKRGDADDRGKKDSDDDDDR